MQCQIPSQSKQTGFVHTDIDSPGAQGVVKRGKHPINKLVSAGFVGKENIINILNFLINRPMEQCVDMGKGLNAGNDRHSVGIGVSVDLPQLLLAVFSAQMTKIWLVFDFVGVFHVQMQGVVAQIGG